MKSEVKKMRISFNTDPKYFKKVYQFTFTYNLTEGARVLPIEVATDYWRLLLADKFSQLDSWITFIEDVNQRAVTRDTWDMILEFCNYLDKTPDLSQYDEEGAWPSIIDEFVEYLRDL